MTNKVNLRKKSLKVTLTAKKETDKLGKAIQADRKSKGMEFHKDGEKTQKTQSCRFKLRNSEKAFVYRTEILRWSVLKQQILGWFKLNKVMSQLS